MVIRLILVGALIVVAALAATADTSVFFKERVTSPAIKLQSTPLVRP